MDYNFHTHTARCHHANGTDEEIVLAAIASGIKVLGFSDHGPFPFTDYTSPARMLIQEAPDYFESIGSLREKYKAEAEIHLGFEYEYYEEYDSFLRQFKKDNSVEYYILGQHFFPCEKSGVCSADITTPEEISGYTKSLIKGIESGLFQCVAHPDLFMSGYGKFDKYAKQAAEEICMAAKQYGLPLEYNIYGLRKSRKASRELYPVKDFWQVAKEAGNKIILGIDAHTPNHFTDSEYIREAENNIKEIFGTLSVLSPLSLCEGRAK